MSIDNNTFAHIPEDLNDLEGTRNFLLLIVQQIDKIIGNRAIVVSNTYSKVEPGASYVQAEAVQVADDLKALQDRVDIIEAKLTPVNSNA